MKTSIFILICITLISFSNINLAKCCLADRNLFQDNSVKSDSMINHGLVEFKDYNKVISFAFESDTIFALTESGVLFYDGLNDLWKIAPLNINRMLKSTPPIYRWLGYGAAKKIPGYPTSVYTTIRKQHGKWFLINHAGEGSYPYKQEIVDTIQEVIYRFPPEMINDFFIEDSMIWVGSDFGISKVNMETLSRTDYTMLPTFKKINKTIESINSIFYLDFHYGLFEIDKLTKKIYPVDDINKYVVERDFKFTNTFLYNDNIYTIGLPMSRDGAYTFRDRYASIFIYNLATKKVTKIETNIRYLDSFILSNDNLICYGEIDEGYEGGDMAYFGGAAVYNTTSGKFTELTNKPIVSLTIENDSLVATSIQAFDVVLMYYEKFRLSMNFNESIEKTVLQTDTLSKGYYGQVNDGDTVVIMREKAIVNRNRFDKYSKLYYSLKEQRLEKTDTGLNKLMVYPAVIKSRNDKIERDRY